MLDLVRRFKELRQQRWAGALRAESYPTSKVRDSCPECQAATVQEWPEEPPRIRGQGWPGGDTPCPRSGAAGRSHLTPEARGGDPEEPPRAQGQGQQLGGATHTQGQCQRPGGATRGAVAKGAQEGLEELSHVEGQVQQW